MVNNNLSDETVKSYDYDIKSYFDFLKNRYSFNEKSDICKLLEMTHETDIVMYLQFCKMELNNSDITINRKLSAIRKLYGQLYNNKTIPYNFAANVPHIKTQQNVHRIFSIDECKELFESIEGKNKYRDTSILMMFLFCGVTVEEACNIKCNDIDGEYIYLRKNGEIKRKVVLNDALKSILSRLFINERISANENLFTTQNGTPINKRTVHQLTVKHLSRAGMYSKGMTSETLRKTGAYFLIHYGGIDSAQIKSYFGGSDKGDTKYFASSSCEIDENVFNKIPLAKMKIE